jgi:esterase/lipase
VLLLSGCGNSQTEIDESTPVIIKEVELINEDEIALAGRLFSSAGNDLAVVLAHSGVFGEDQEGLHPLAQGFAEEGITALTFDFQGFGKTGGETAFSDVNKDVQAAVSYLRRNGYQRIICLGVGIGGTACAKVSREVNLVGIVLVSAPIEITTGKLIEEPELEMVISKLEITSEDLHDLGFPVLFVAAEEDRAAGRPFAEMARTMYALSTEPKEIVIFPGTDHSMELFRSEHGEELNKLLLEFFEGIK